jgi:hypothetical protein
METENNINEPLLEEQKSSTGFSCFACSVAIIVVLLAIVGVLVFTLFFWACKGTSPNEPYCFLVNWF